MESEKRKKELESLLESYAEGGRDICLAFSGGVDSSLLLKAGAEAAGRHGSRIYAVTFDTRLHPSCDLQVAERVAGELGGDFHVISVDELEQEELKNNPVNRCYLCKRHLFSTLKEFAEQRGISTVLDGTNEDDLHVYRPGIQALKELGIVSPLAMLHMTKKEVKELAAAYGISVASRPSTPCMATRLPYNTQIDYEILEKIEKGEAYLRSLLGDQANIRLRLHGETARLEIDPERFPSLLAARAQVAGFLKQLGFRYITLDLEGFRSGSMDICPQLDAIL